MLVIDEDVYLEHHGVKGMRWGVRNDDREDSQGLSKQAKKKLLLGAGAAVAVGAVAVGLILNHNKQVNLSEISRARNVDSFNKFWSAHKDGPLGIRRVKVKTLPKLIVDGKPTPHDEIMKSIARERITSIKEANDQLKFWNNRNDVPIPERKYLDPSHWEKILNR